MISIHHFNRALFLILQICALVYAQEKTAVDSTKQRLEQTSFDSNQLQSLKVQNFEKLTTEVKSAKKSSVTSRPENIAKVEKIEPSFMDQAADFVLGLFADDEDVPNAPVVVQASTTDLQKPTAVKQCSIQGLADLVRKDINQFQLEEAKYIRYISFYHTLCNGATERDLKRFLRATNKLLNSLSWNKKLFKVVPIDSNKSIFRLDLRNYHTVIDRTEKGLLVNLWDTEHWEQLVKLDPYHLLVHESIASDIIYKTDGQFPWLRGDWFINKASRTPVYENMLGISGTRQRIEHLLGVDVKADIKNGKAIRAGFNRSGVSAHNRVIQRHDTKYGAYWLSYDFGSSVGKKSITNFPLGPDDDVDPKRQFEADGGEFIFNLPNGLQAYFLSDAQGNQLDKGPIDVVSHAETPDRKVHNAMSCMNCHGKGIIDKAEDDVAKSVIANELKFSRGEIEKVKNVYKGAEIMRQKMDLDIARFAAAMKAIDNNPDAEDDILKTGLEFEADIDLEKMAAELGVTEVRLRAIAAQSEFSDFFSPLLHEGGSIKRVQVLDLIRPENSDALENLKLQLVGSNSKLSLGFVPDKKLMSAMGFILRECIRSANNKDVDYETELYCMTSRLNELKQKKIDILDSIDFESSRFSRAKLIVAACIESQESIEDQHFCIKQMIVTAKATDFEPEIGQSVGFSIQNLGARSNFFKALGAN